MTFVRYAVAWLITVLPSIAMAGSALLTWTAPDLNEDGTAYTNPSHYTIYAGCIQSGQYEEQTLGPIPYTQTSVTMTALPESKNCYFVATATNTDGVESGYSGEAVKYIDSTVTLADPVENLVIEWSETMSDFIKVPWTVQPPTGTRLDKTHPLYGDIAIAVVHDGTGRDVEGILTDIQVLGNGSYVVGEAGKAYYQDGHVYADRIELNSHTAPAFDLNWEGGFSEFHLFKFLGPFSQDEYGIAGQQSDGVGDWVTVIASSNTVEDQQVHSVSTNWVSGSGNTSELFLDGVSIGSGSSGNPGGGGEVGFVTRYDSLSNQWEMYGQAGTRSGGIIIGAHESSRPDDGWNGEIYLSVFFRRALTAAEHAALAANPWQIFQPELVPVFAAAAGGSETASGSAALAALSASGLAERTSIKITDVNTTESWTDGDAGLVITGSGFK